MGTGTASPQSFVRAVYAMARSRGDVITASAFLGQRFPYDAAASDQIAKTAVSAGTSSDIGGTSSPATAYLSTVIPRTATGKLIAAGAHTAPLNQRVLTSTAIPAGTEVAEGQPAPMAPLNLATSVLAPRKFVTLFATTNEVLQSNDLGALTYFDELLNAAMRVLVDRALVLSLQGVASATITSSGTTAATFATDLIAALDALIAAGSDLTAPFILMHPRVAAALALRLTSGVPGFPQLGAIDGSLAAIPIISTASAGYSVSGGGQVIIVDAARVLAALGSLDAEVSQEAALQFTDTPAAGATSLVSLYQANLTALRATFYGNITGSAVSAVIDGVH